MYKEKGLRLVYAIESPWLLLHSYRHRLGGATLACAPQYLRNAYAFISYCHPFPPKFPPPQYI